METNIHKDSRIKKYCKLHGQIDILINRHKGRQTYTCRETDKKTDIYTYR